MRETSYKLLLSLCSLVLVLGLVELGLRKFRPRYEYAAESAFQGDVDRIWSRKPNTRGMRRHPDTGRSHLVRHNNLALRQHRDFTAQDIESSRNLGFFGDSFTENIRLPSQYSFTEPLDYLLNTGDDRFNVLNLGVDGYGADQSYIYYQEFEYSADLDCVFYVFCVNDLRNIYENGLLSLNDSGELVRHRPAPSPWWMRLTRRFHTTYLVIDALQRLDLLDDEFDEKLEESQRRLSFVEEQKREYDGRFHDERADAIDAALLRGAESEDLRSTLAIFREILRSWKREVEESGGRFYVVLLPREKEHGVRGIFEPGFQVIDLFEEFTSETGDSDSQAWFFQSNRHWNEAGNHLAAVHLYRLMERELGLPEISDRKLREEVFTYYSSFAGWMPAARHVEEIEVPASKRARIRAKYSGRRGGR